MKRFLLTLALLGASCSPGSTADSDESTDAEGLARPGGVTLPAATPQRVVTFVDDRSEFATVAIPSGAAVHARRSWNSRISLDRSYAVSTVTVGPGDTKIVWDALGTASDPVLGGTIVEGIELEPTATQLDGLLAALVTPATPVEGAIAGARTASTIVIAGPDGERWRTQLDGNFEPEAFGRRLGGDGLPAQLFLLEYFPADSPEFYRVRVLSTATGEVSPPVDLRNKSDLVDERMAGFGRDQIVAHEHGLLFTLYRGSIDGTPDGEPYGFVHTLDFGDGVWCLSIDPALELGFREGTIATSEDRLYVASSNGMVGVYDIPSISDPDLDPTMRWVQRVHFGGETAPVMIADGDGVLLGYGDDRLLRLRDDGTFDDAEVLPGRAPSALARTSDGAAHAVGTDWSTLDVSPPTWLGRVTEIILDGGR